MSPVTAESPQGTTNAAPAKSGSMGSQQLRIGILVVVAAIVGVGLWLALSHNSGKKKVKQHPRTSAIGPLALSQTGLMAHTLAVGQPVYWAGPKRGVRYEFWRLTNDNIYIRYLPHGVRNGAPGKKYLIIGTYPFSNAYNALKKISKNRGVSGPRGSYIWARPNDPRSVLIAWPKVPYEVEVYDPSATKAATIAESGQVKPVG
jgi:hypothetical protein